MAIAIIDEQMEIGQVKSITSDFGRHIDYTELLFSPTTKAQFVPNVEKTGIILSVSDNNLDLPEMVCELSRDTVRNLIVNLKNMYNELSEPVEEKDTDDTDNSDKETKPSVGVCCRKKFL